MNRDMHIYLIGGVMFGAILFFAVIFMQVLGRSAKWQEKRIKEGTYRELEDLFIFVDFEKLTYVNFAAFLFVPVLVWIITSNPIFTTASVLLPIFAPKWIVARVRQKRLDQFISQFPDALMMLSSSLRAGSSLAVAMENLVNESKAPLSQEFAMLIRSQRLGASFEDAVRDMERRLPIQEFMLFSAGLRIAREVGGNLADMLESLAETLYTKMQTEGKIKSLTAQGKIQGVVMSGLPILLMLVLTQLQPVAMHPLFHSVTGWGVLTLIAAMEFMGYIGIRKITSIDV
ncbi:MAG: type II secretion system F family protein [Acidithiobacillus sp.]